MSTDDAIAMLERVLEISAEHGDAQAAAIARAERDVGEYGAAAVTALWSLPDGHRLTPADVAAARVLVDELVDPAYRERARQYLARLAG